MDHSHAGDPRYATLEMRRTGRGSETVEVRPAHCPNGHSLAGRNCRVGWGTALDGLPRRSWQCTQCQEITWGT